MWTKDDRLEAVAYERYFLTEAGLMEINNSIKAKTWWTETLCVVMDVRIFQQEENQHRLHIETASF